jgi:U3 small nucleolar ribonucleoprotein component
MKPSLPAIQIPGNTPFQKMDNLFRAVIAVSKEEIDKREKEWKRAQKRKKAAKR